MAKAVGYYTHVGDSEETLGFWLQIGLAPAIVATWMCINEWKIFPFVSPPLFLTILYKNLYKNKKLKQYKMYKIIKIICIIQFFKNCI